MTLLLLKRHRRIRRASVHVAMSPHWIDRRQTTSRGSYAKSALPAVQRRILEEVARGLAEGRPLQACTAFTTRILLPMTGSLNMPVPCSSAIKAVCGAAEESGDMSLLHQRRNRSSNAQMAASAGRGIALCVWRYPQMLIDIAHQYRESDPACLV
jgi:hypothetical protein